MRDFIALCWYVPCLREVCQDRLACSASTSFLLVAQHVSGNHVPIIMRCFHFFSTSCTTCFGQPCAHHHEVTTALCYSLVLECAVAAGTLSRPVGM